MPVRKIVIEKPALTPFNVVAGIIVVVGLVITVIRFTQGLGHDQPVRLQPVGIWIGFDLLVGSPGGRRYVTSAACYIFGLKRFHSAVRPAILTGFLGYALVVLACTTTSAGPGACRTLHRPVGYDLAALRGGGLRRTLPDGALHRVHAGGARVAGAQAGAQHRGQADAGADHLRVVLSTLHQSSLGALFLIAPRNCTPLVLAVPGALLLRLQHRRRLSMVIFEGSLAHKHFHDKMDAEHLRERTEWP